MDIATAVASETFGVASARKSGRNPLWPYVPIVDHGNRTEQIRGRAFESRAEAVAYATMVIDGRRSDLVNRLSDPRYRSLREQYGLPREISTATT